MNHLKLWIVAALAAALALSMFASVSAQPPPLPPSAFIGTVTAADGNPAATGLTVEAYVGTTRCNANPEIRRTFTRRSGVTEYFVMVANDGQIDGCGERNAKVRFKIGDNFATQTGTFGAGITTLNLTLTDAVAAVNIQVAVWRRVETPFNALADLFISTKAPGEDWDTRNTALPMSARISSDGVHRFDRSELTPVTIQLADGPVTINVAVWRRVSNPTLLYISTQAPGEKWVTHNTALDMSDLSSSGRYHRSDLRTVVVELQ